MKQKITAATRIVFILATLSLGFVSCGQNSVKEKTIMVSAEIRPEINYVTHLYTLAGLGFSDEAYTSEYAGTLPLAAVDTLRKYKDLLTFGQGEGGYMAGPFFFGISRENIPNADSMRVLKATLMEEGRKMNAPQEMMQAAEAIADVFVDNYDKYLKEVYPHAKQEMEQRMNLLNEQLKNNSFVRDWERVTGYTWNNGDYHWLLYRAGVNGPSYNNLDANTNTVYYNQPLDYQLSMFSHEFGIFLMMDSINPVMEEMKEYTRSLQTEQDLTYVPWSAFESLSCWYNCKIAGQVTVDRQNFGEADVERFCAIYDQLEKQGITTPADLYRQAILEYIKGK